MSEEAATVQHASAIEALIAAQLEFPEIPKDRENTYFKSWYSTLDAIITACRPPLNRHGFVVNHVLEKIGEEWTTTAQLLHVTGEAFKNSLPLSPGFGALSQQAKGSELTYSRRYSLAPLLGITSDEDDDGNAARQQEPAPKRQTAKEQSPSADREKPKQGRSPLTAWQNKFVKAADATQFDIVLKALQAATELFDKFPDQYRQVFLFAGQNAEARRQKGQFVADDPVTVAVEERIEAIRKKIEDHEAAAAAAGKPATHQQPGMF